MVERDRKTIESALRRSAGMSEEGKQAMDNFLSTKSDWYMQCKKCDEKIVGTIEELKNHDKSCK